MFILIVQRSICFQANQFKRKQIREWNKMHKKERQTAAFGKEKIKHWNWEVEWSQWNPDHSTYLFFFLHFNEFESGFKSSTSSHLHKMLSNLDKHFNSWAIKSNQSIWCSQCISSVPTLWARQMHDSKHTHTREHIYTYAKRAIEIVTVKVKSFSSCN